MRKGLGRTAKTVAVAMPPSDWDWVESRLVELGKSCANRSHYFRMLIDLDRSQKLIEQVSMFKPRDHKHGGVIKDDIAKIREAVIAQPSKQSRRKPDHSTSIVHS